MKITGILMAAGMSSRMPHNKLLLAYRNHTVVEESLRQLMDTQVDDIIIVTGHESSRIRNAIAEYLSPKIHIVENENYRLGRAESIKCAIREISEHSDAVLFMVADKPGVSSRLIDKAIGKFKEEKPGILYVTTPAGRGHPIIFSRDLFDELLLLEGDRVGNDLIAKYAGRVVELPDDRIQIDIDMEDDYTRLIKGMKQSE